MSGALTERAPPADHSAPSDPLVDLRRGLLNALHRLDDAIGNHQPRGTGQAPELKLSRQEMRSLGELSARLYRERRARERFFDATAIFSEPSWDILLDLYAQGARGRLVSVGSACIGSAAPYTTALRHLDVLQKRGLIERHPDPNDARRLWVQLTPEARQALESYLKEVS